MNTPKLTTVRWRLPSTLRQQRLQELLGKDNLRDILGQDFVKGLEARKDMLESREFKLIGLQLPLLLLLIFSVLNIDVKVSLFGFSAETIKGLREILLVLSTTIGLAFYTNKFCCPCAKGNACRSCGQTSKRESRSERFLGAAIRSF